MGLKQHLDKKNEMNGNFFAEIPFDVNWISQMNGKKISKTKKEN